MKYLKKFNESLEDIDSICKKYGIQNYTINGDGTVDVDGNVDIFKRNLSKLPLKFGRVTGNFYCHSNKLTTLEGCPKEVGGSFHCSDNKLTTLEGCPKEVGYNFYCHNNQITIINSELEFVKINGDFDIEYNPIYEVYKLFPDFESFKYSLDYNYFRYPNQIVKNRFEEACEEAGITAPEKIIGYQYI
jgi:hypothetical protein